jgi:hypothetical protein
MQCIFCHKDSSNSKSVKHIISESLGINITFCSKVMCVINATIRFAIAAMEYKDLQSDTITKKMVAPHYKC